MNPYGSNIVMEKLHFFLCNFEYKIIFCYAWVLSFKIGDNITQKKELVASEPLAKRYVVIGIIKM